MTPVVSVFVYKNREAKSFSEVGFLINDFNVPVHARF